MWQHFVVWKAHTHTHTHTHAFTHTHMNIWLWSTGKALMRSYLISGLAHGQIFKWVKFFIATFLLSSLSSCVLLRKLSNAIRFRDPHWGTFPFYFLLPSIKSCQSWASLVAQWLTLCLLMQGTRVRALVWEDPTCRGATRPVSQNYWACASGACAPQQERPR